MKAGWATADITPQLRVPLAGYGSRVAPFTEVHDPLEANAMVIEHAGRRLFLVSLDLLYAGPVVTRFLEQVLGAHGIHSDDIFVTATHTHFAPATDPTIAASGRADEGYLEYLLDRLARLVDEVLNSGFVDVTIWHRKLRLPFCVNRRRQWPIVIRRSGIEMKVIVNAPNPSGKRDETADLLVVKRPDGAPRALIWRFACHPVSFPLVACVSAEYPGVVRKATRRAFGSGFPILFWQGFAGDIRPTLCAPPRFRSVLSTLVRGPRFSRVSMAAWNDWSQQIADAVVDGMRSREGAILPEGPLDTSSHAVPASRFIRGATSEKSLRVQRLSIGSSLTVLFASAEVVAEHADVLQMALGADAIGVGCAGDVFGYLPTDEQVRKGGYESAEWLDGFGIGKGFSESLDALWQEMLVAVADRAAPDNDVVSSFAKADR